MYNKQNKLITVWLLACLLCLAVGPSGAQTIGIYQAITQGIDNYPLLQQRQAEIAAGKAHVTTANGERLPSLTLQDQVDAGTNNSLQGSYLTYGMIPSSPGNNNSPVQNNKANPDNVAVSFFEWNVCNFGYYNSLVKAAKAQLAINQAAYGSDKYQLTENIIALYLDWLKKYRLLQIQNENVQRYHVILTAIRATVNSGLKPGVDSSTASAAYSDARINYLQALDEYNTDKIALGAFTGMNTTGAVPDTTLSADYLTGAAPVKDQANVPEEHPLLALYKTQYEAQIAENETISRKYLPHLGLEGVTWLRNSGISYSGVYPSDVFSGMPYSKYNYLFGATLTYNLFDLKHRQNELNEGRFQAQARQQALKTEQVTLSATLQQANATYAATTNKLAEIPAELAAARQAYGQQLALYRSGLNTLIEVTNAQYMLLQAETTYVNMQDQLLQLLYLRAGLSGQLDGFVQNLKK